MSMKVGFFETDITPFIGMERPGGYGKVYIEKIHDPLKARAFVAEENGEKIGICVLDTLVIHSRKFVNEIRDEIENRLGIKKENLLISATHTHSGGPLFGPLPSEYEDAPEIVKILLSKYSVISAPFYYEFVKKRVIDAISMADRLKEDVLCQAGYGFEEGVSFNRRFKMRHGRVYTHPGKGNPDILQPAGPVDSDVGVLSFWNKNNLFLGCLVNFACHCTTGCDGASADWLYYTEKIIRKTMGENSIVILLQGASGDVTQVNNLSDREPEFGEKWASYTGTRIGLESLKVILTEDKYDFSPLKCKSNVFNVERRKQSEEKLKKAEGIVKKGLEDENVRNTTEWTFAKERVIYDYLFKKQKEIEIEVQAIQIGPVIIVSNPGEFFCSLGKKIKERSHFPFTFVVELSNGNVGYLPDKDSFSPSGGGYETVLTSYSNCNIMTGEKIVEESIKIIETFKPQKIYRKSYRSSTVWSYGILGPDID